MVWAGPSETDGIFLLSCGDTRGRTGLQLHCSSVAGSEVLHVVRAHLRRDTLWGVNADAGVPFARWKHRDLIQELVNARQQVIPGCCLVGNMVENLVGTENKCGLTAGCGGVLPGCVFPKLCLSGLCSIFINNELIISENNTSTVSYFTEQMLF